MPHRAIGAQAGAEGAGRPCAGPVPDRADWGARKAVNSWLGRLRELLSPLLRHVLDFLLELGVGFAFVGSQYAIEVEDREYRLDLLFYNLRLR